MKKLLLALTVLLGTGAAAQAKDYTINPLNSKGWTVGTYTYEGNEKSTATGTFKVDGATFTFTVYQEKSSTAIAVGGALQESQYR